MRCSTGRRCPATPRPTCTSWRRRSGSCTRPRCPASPRPSSTRWPRSARRWAGPGPPPARSRPARSRPGRSRPGRSRPGRSRPGRRSARVRWLSARIAAAGAAVVISLGGAAAAAAYTGALPDMLHRLTQHRPGPAVTAIQPPAQPTAESRSAAPGPGHGRCAAYQHALADGSPSEQARALGKLVAAAGGTGNVTAYCAGVVEAKPAAGGQHTHPAHPAHPAHPVHPAHPAHPSHGSR